MKKYHIPFDFISQDGESSLHDEVNKDIKFSKYHKEMNDLIGEAITDVNLKDRFSETCQLVYIFAEIAAYREGFKEGISFFTKILTNNYKPEKTCKRDKDYSDAFDRFLGEYRLDRIADVHDFLEENELYKKLHMEKMIKEKTLQASISDTTITDALLNYITAVDFLIDEVKSILYEHGFQDCISIIKVLQSGIKI